MKDVAAQAGGGGVLAVAELPRGVQDPAGEVRVDRHAVEDPGDGGQADPCEGRDVLHRGTHMDIHIWTSSIVKRTLSNTRQETFPQPTGTASR